jgi:uncharacterized protein
MAHFRKDVLSFILGTGCNFNCNYCLAGDIKEKSQKIDLDFAKKGIDEFFKTRKSRHIRFYAMGEPTLFITEIKKIYNYAKRKAGSRLTVEMQSHGAFSKKIRDWIWKNVDILWVSLDGPADVQDVQRKTRSGRSLRYLIEENIKYLLTKDIFIGARPTITKLNIYRQKEMIDYYLSLGIKTVWSHHEFSEIGSKNAIKNNPVSQVSLIDYAKEVVKAHKYAEKLGVFYRPFLAASFDEPCMYSCRACLPGWHLTFDGYVSACDMAFHGKTNFKDLIWGRWNSDKKKIEYDFEKVKFLRNRTWKNIPECSKCKVSMYCAGGCLGEAYFQTGSINGIRKDHCKAVRYLAKHLPINKGEYLFQHP